MLSSFARSDTLSHPSPLVGQTKCTGTGVSNLATVVPPITPIKIKRCAQGRDTEEGKRAQCEREGDTTEKRELTEDDVMP